MNRNELRASYDTVAEAYSANFFDELSRKSFDRGLLTEFAQAHGGGTILDVGCGPGHVARYLAESSVKSEGLDLSPQMVKVAQRLSPDLTFQVGDMHSLPFEDRSLSGVVAFYSLIHIPRHDVVAVLKEFCRVLQAQGGLLLAVHGGTGEVRSEEFQGHRVPFEATLFELEELQSLIDEAGFTTRRAIERPPYEFEHQTQRIYVWGLVPI